jgi:hypothetical protein
VLVPPRRRVSSTLSPAVRPLIKLVRDRFYGINLNQNVVLQQIGYDGKEGTPWHRLFKVSTGGMIITALGFVPGKKILNINFIHETKYLIRNDSF